MVIGVTAGQLVLVVALVVIAIIIFALALRRKKKKEINKNDFNEQKPQEEIVNESE